MTGESMGFSVNVRIKEIDRITGLTRRTFVGHNKITESGLRIIADYISAYFNSGNLDNEKDNSKNFLTLINNLPDHVEIGTNTKMTADGPKRSDESYNDTGLFSPLKDPVTNKTISLNLSDGSSTLQSAFQGSLSSVSSDNYSNGITISYSVLSRSDTFENFKTDSNGVILSNSGQTIYMKELALMSSEESNKCWARIALDKNGKPGFALNKNRVYDIVWNINLVSMDTQLIEMNS